VRRVLALLRAVDRDLVMEIPSRVDSDWTTLPDAAGFAFGVALPATGLGIRIETERHPGCTTAKPRQRVW
jgi:hypothetical protein